MSTPEARIVDADDAVAAGTTTHIDHADLVRRLSEHQTRLGLNGSQFARRKLHVSSATWSRIQAGNYPLADNNLVTRELRSALTILDGDVEYGRPDATAIATITTVPLQAVLDAVRGARSEPRNRLVTLLSPTGGGKTWVLRTIVETYPERSFVVEATESWRGSYFAALRSIGLAAGVSETNLGGVKAAEESLIAHLNREQPIVCIDEAHYLGPRTLNLVKLILNATPCVVVMAAIPTLWDMMQRGNSLESDQVRNRAYATIRENRTRPTDVAALLRSRIQGIERMPDWKEVVTRITDAANRFGLLNTVDRIARAIRDESGGKAIEREHVATAIAVAEAMCA